MAGRSTTPRGAPTPNYLGNSYHSHESPEEPSPTAGSDPLEPNDLKRPRACEVCRQLKVKCELSESNVVGACKRCAKANRLCVVTAPSKKRQKKTDSRVAELEKKIDALTASLSARGGHEDGSSFDPPTAQSQLPELQQHWDTTSNAPQWMQIGQQKSIFERPPSATPQSTTETKRKFTNEYNYLSGEIQRAAPQSFKSPTPAPNMSTMFNVDSMEGKRSLDEPYIDVIDRQLIDAETAYRCFDRYTAEMCEQLPIVVFRPGTRAEDIRKTKKMLFLAVLAVSSGTIRPDLQPKLVSEITRIFADRIVYRGERSLELCQTIQVMTIFYQPPQKYEELNVNQLIHIAAVMALDMGMGKRSKVGTFTMWKKYMDKKQSLPDSNTAETRRCWLGTYYMCAK
jgi:Fungal Zn(2)-Cys(6) binuclear cluster domain